MSGFRLLTLDLDGTLLDSARRLRPRSLAALAAAAEQGVTLAVITGRSAPAVRHYMRLIRRATGRPVWGAGCNGAAILHPDGRLWAGYPIPAGLVVPALELLRAHGLVPSCYTPTGVVLDRSWVHLGLLAWSQERVGWGVAAALKFAWLNRMRPVLDLRRWAERSRQPVLKIFALAPGPDPAASLRAAAAALAERLPSLHRTASGPDNLELTGPGVHKGRALRTLAAMLKVPREATLAVGDGPNDREMLAEAGLGVVMANGAPELVATAGWVAPSCDEDGVAATIERFILKAR